MTTSGQKMRHRHDDPHLRGEGWCRVKPTLVLACEMLHIQSAVATYHVPVMFENADSTCVICTLHMNDLIKGDACKWEVGKGCWSTKKGGAVILQLTSELPLLPDVDSLKFCIKRTDPAMSIEPVPSCERHHSNVKVQKVSCRARCEICDPRDILTSQQLAARR